MIQPRTNSIHARLLHVAAILFAFGCCIAEAAIPHKINYQGYLTSSAGTPITASLPMVLKLYTVSSGGTESYSETQTVLVTNGIFNVTIGAVTALTLPFDVPYYLGIKVGADVAEMTPRQLVAASPYSLRSASADTLGSVGNVPVEISANSTRVMRFEPNSFTANVIGGNYANSVTANAYAATIAGGGVLNGAHQVTDHYGTVGGGFANRAGNADANPDNSQFATVAGGKDNLATGGSSTVAGGANNSAQGYASTVAGGASNVAQGDFSFAAGVNAIATHHRSFVWGGDVMNYTGTLADGDFVVYAPGAIRLFAATAGTGGCTIGIGGVGGNLSCNGTITASNIMPSDRALKTDLVPVTPQSVLERVIALPVAEWSFKSAPDVRHIGPMAQDFKRIFGVGSSDKFITNVDGDGVALAAIQGLNAKLEAKLAELTAAGAAQRARIEALELLGLELALIKQQMARLVGLQAQSTGPATQPGLLVRLK